MESVRKGDVMKRLFSIVICIGFNVSGMYQPRNTKVVFNNTPRGFGTTHFIVGYNENNVSKLKKANAKPVVHKKQNMVAEGGTLINKNRLSQSFFTTVHDLSPILKEVISEPTKRLYVAAFTLTDLRIVNSIIDAHKKGVDVCMITDAGNMKQSYSKVQQLVDNNIPVWCYKPKLNPAYKKNGLSEPYMHHKLIIGDNFVVTGSANLTKAGQKTNMENITILRDTETVEEYLAEFNRLIKFCTKCLPQNAA
jgi:phosphatidylserine/phosphatidylglycerophosphate/cardiolipin synthase-like enzyme